MDNRFLEIGKRIDLDALKEKIEATDSPRWWDVKMKNGDYQPLAHKSIFLCLISLIQENQEANEHF